VFFLDETGHGMMAGFSWIFFNWIYT